MWYLVVVPSLCESETSKNNIGNIQETYIIGADTYFNISSTGVTKVSNDVMKMNTGDDTANGYVVAWTNITAADGSFTIRSENVGSVGPGEPNKSYGLQGFMLKELSP